MSTQSNEARDRADYGFARTRDLAFDAVRELWDRRRSEGMTQMMLAKAIGRDAGWVSKNLRAPGNWTLRVFGELVQGLNGEVEISIEALEDQQDTPCNYDAYSEYFPVYVNSVAEIANVSPIGFSWQPDGLGTFSIITNENSLTLEAV